MRVLGFDTATGATAVALLDTSAGERTIEARDDPPSGERPRHASRLLTLITEVLSSAELGWDDLDRIAVGLGPGTFTGLRIGIATARGLAQARSIPLVGVSTLQSLALNAVGPSPAADSAVAAPGARIRGGRIQTSTGGLGGSYSGRVLRAPSG
jgi:tRNA threonylcarbamoyladenosine biosynthesis protein TsaB